MANFADLFCRRYRITRDRYARALFWRCLHRQAIPLVPILRLLDDRYFAPDFDLIEGMAGVETRHEMHEELFDFETHPLNHGFLRRSLKLRVSEKRVIDLATSLLRSECERARPPASASPSLRN